MAFLKAKGKDVHALDDRRIRAAFVEHWEAFQFLHAGRGFILGEPQPIAGTEVSNWLDERRITDPELRREFHEVLRAIDSAYFSEMREMHDD